MSTESRVLHVGLICVSNPAIGGGRTYEELMLRAVLDQFGDRFRFTVFSPNPLNVEGISDDPKLLPLRPYSAGTWSRTLQMFRNHPLGFRFLEWFRWHLSDLERQLLREQVDIAYFLSPNDFSSGVSGLPLISTIWDMAHTRLPEFPEVTTRRRAEYRDRSFGVAARKSIAVIVDSARGKADVVSAYGVDEERVIPISFSSVVEAWGVPLEPSLNQVVYPAQFWPHKNHVVLVKALRLLLDQGRATPHLLFVGGDQGNESYIRKLTTELGLSQRVTFTGFVSASDLKNHVLASRGLVMPTFLGPTNLPPIEALKSGIPVAVSTSDSLSQHADGKSIRAIDPLDVDGWADALEDFASNRMTRPARAPSYLSDSKDQLDRLGDRLARFAAIRCSWDLGPWGR